MVEYQPAWLTDELNKALARLTGRYGRLKRTTILRLAEGRATGRTDEETWKLPDTCTKTTWHGQRRGSREAGWVQTSGWKDAPDIQAALQAAVARAQWWQDQAEARRIAKRQDKFAEAQDLLAEYSPLAVQRLFVLMGQAGNEETRRKAANDILDRADQATAVKTVAKQTEENVSTIDLSSVPDELLAILANLLPEDGTGPGPAGTGSSGGTK